MSTAARVSSFVAGLVLVLAASWAVGSAVGPVDEPTSDPHSPAGSHDPGGTDAEHP